MWELAFGRGANLRNGRPPRIRDFRSDQILSRAKRNAARLDYIGFTETCDRDAVAIFRALGAGKVQAERANATIDRPALDTLPRETIVLLNEMTELDRELYNHFWCRRGTLRRVADVIEGLLGR